MSAAPLLFHFDFVSPYAYLGWKGVHAVAARHGREVEPVPVLFAALLDHHGQRGPAEIPAKRAYTFKNVMRVAHAAGIHVEPPPAHPFNPLLALRAACVAWLSPGERRALIDRLYDAAWAGGGGVADVEAVARAVRAAGLDAERVLADAASSETKARLRANTDAAIARGVFGVPTTIADGEPFWGYDALPHLDAFLRGEDPARPELLERWKDLPVGAARKAVAT